MPHKGEFDDRKASVRGWSSVNRWAVKGPILIMACLLGFFDHELHWGRAVFAAGLAMTIVTIGFRASWNEVRFWITLVLLGVLQVPLVLLVSPMMEQLKFPFMFVFGIVDTAVLGLAISWVCSQHDGKSA